MTTGTTTQPRSVEPLVQIDNFGASLDRIDRLVMPISQPMLRGAQYGETESRLRGQGVERDGVRDYQPGDDPRYIDWKLTARTPGGVPQLRLHQKDITPSLWLATDAPQERNRTTPGKDFMEQEIALSAAMATILLADKEGMTTGLMAISDRDRFLEESPTVGRNHTYEIGRQLINLAEANPEVSERDAPRQHLAELLKRLGHVADENLLVIVSDFRDADPDDTINGWRKPLQQLKHQGNDIIAIEPTNLWDFTMDGVERPRFASGKTAWLGFGRKDGKAIRKNYAEVVAPAQQAQIDHALKSVGAAHIKLDTRESRWFTSLRQQLDKAGRRTR